MHIIHIDGRWGSGKSTVINHLNKALWWETTKTNTSRKPRYKGEKGYNFVTHKEFLEKIQNNEVLECYFRKSNQSFYWVWAPWKNGIYQTEIMWRVALQKWCLQNDVPFLSIFLHVDEQTLLDRLIKRGDKNEDPHARMKEDRYYETFKNWCDVVYDYNDKNVEQWTMELLEIINAFLTK